MKKFLGYILLANLTIACYSQNKTGATKSPDHISLSWTEDPHTTRCITWRTDTTVIKGEILYAKVEDSVNFDKKSLKIQENATIYKTNSGNINLHSAQIRGLVPGQMYCYKVGYKNSVSKLYTFKTEGENTNSFKFLVFGDSQSGEARNANYSPFKTTIQNAYQANKDACFFINMGDLVEIGKYYNHWNEWYKAADGVINYISAMPVQGNHETYVDSTESIPSKPSDYTNQFKVPQNGPDGFKGQVYSYDYGNVHFVVWDSQIAEEKHTDSTMLPREIEWLDNDLKNTTQTWKIVLFHKTPYYNKAIRTNDRLKEALIPVFDKYHVDFVFNGHDHGISRTFPMKADHFMERPSMGTIYYVMGRSGNKYYKDLSAKVWDAFFYDPQDQPNYVVVEVNNQKLTLNAIKQNGTLIDRYTVDKSADIDEPRTVVPTRYHDTRLAIFGNLIQTPLLAIPPKKINNKWYIQAKTFAYFLGGNVSNVKNDSIQITLNTVSSTLPILPNTELISADDLCTLFKFTYRYDELTNILMFSKYGGE